MAVMNIHLSVSREQFIAFAVLTAGFLTLSVFYDHHLAIFSKQVLRVPLPPRNTISPLFISQNLSHGHFHNPFTKPYLRSLVTTTPSQAVVIIGLETGEEAIAMSKTHAVHAFEALPNYVEAFKSRPSEVTENVTVYPVAATENDGEIEVIYRGRNEKVQARRAGPLLPEGIEVSVISLDVQGGEFSALKGLRDVIDRTASVWVEVGCPAKGNSPQEMLEFLERDFVLFDYVPWGERPGVTDMWAREQFLLEERPDGIPEWVQWLCRSSEKFTWLQTDIVGIRRSLLEENRDIMKALQKIGDKTCLSGCFLRQALFAEG